MSVSKMSRMLRGILLLSIVALSSAGQLRHGWSEQLDGYEELVAQQGGTVIRSAKTIEQKPAKPVLQQVIGHSMEMEDTPEEQPMDESNVFLRQKNEDPNSIALDHSVTSGSLDKTKAVEIPEIVQSRPRPEAITSDTVSEASNFDGPQEAGNKYFGVVMQKSTDAIVPDRRQAAAKSPVALMSFKAKLGSEVTSETAKHKSDKYEMDSEPEGTEREPDASSSDSYSTNDESTSNESANMGQDAEAISIGAGRGDSAMEEPEQLSSDSNADAQASVDSYT
eukprot:GILJ01011511.1.p1 GENE.GILJ01011511.1~~GILJ01011511.1.p1  ORF type:complete len:280 (-),score=54.12 GILJ01011511.1:137-976(-)